MSQYWIQIGTYMGVNILLALAMYITMSTNQLSAAHGAFAALGGYASGVATGMLGVPFPLALLVGIAAPAVIGTLVAYPALRLRGMYFAIATFAFGETVVVVLYNLDVLGGPTGLRGIPLVTTPWVVWGVVVLVVLALVRFHGSRLERSFRSVHDDEQAAEANGIDVNRCRIQSLALGAGLAGLAGSLHAHYLGIVIPSDASFARSVDILLYPVVGGTQVFVGPIVGAVILTVLPELLRLSSRERFIIYGIVLVALVVLRPQGLVDRAMVRRLGDWISPIFRLGKRKEHPPAPSRDIEAG